MRHWIALGRNLFRKERIDRELDEEIRAYLELMAAEKIWRGMPREEALQEARRELGSLELVKQDVRESRIGFAMDTLMQDLRFALRSIRRNAAFFAVAVLTPALGIGANTTIFTVVNGVLLKPLPYPEPDRLLMLWASPSGWRLRLFWLVWSRACFLA